MKSAVGNNDRFSLLFKYVLVLLLTPHSNASIVHDVLREYFLWLMRKNQRAVTVIDWTSKDLYRRYWQ